MPRMNIVAAQATYQAELKSIPLAVELQDRRFE
jgi:hypothetical protein